MNEKSTMAGLEALFGAIVREARANPAFARSLQEALQNSLGALAPPDALPSKPIIAKPSGKNSGKNSIKKSANTSAKAAAKPSGRAPDKVSGERPARLKAEPAKVGKSMPKALSKLDLSQLLAERGRRGAQDALLAAPYSATQLRAYGAACGVDLRGAGRRRRDIIDRLIAGAPHARAEAFV